MHALEQAVAGDLLRRLAEQLLRGERSEEHAAFFVMPGDHVGRILGQQPVAVFAGAHRALRAPLHELHHRRQRRGIAHGAGGADQRQQRGRERQQICCLQVGKCRGGGENGETEPGNAGGPGDNATIVGKRRLDRHDHHPGNEPGGEAAGEPGAISDQSGEIRRRGEVGGGESPGPRQEDGNADRRQQPEEGDGPVKRRLAADAEVDGKDAEREQPTEQMRGDERLVARRRQRIATRALMHERAEIGCEPAPTFTIKHAHLGAGQAPLASPDCLAEQYWRRALKEA